MGLRAEELRPARDGRGPRPRDHPGRAAGPRIPDAPARGARRASRQLRVPGCLARAPAERRRRGPRRGRGGCAPAGGGAEPDRHRQGARARPARGRGDGEARGGGGASPGRPLPHPRELSPGPPAPRGLRLDALSRRGGRDRRDRVRRPVVPAAQEPAARREARPDRRGSSLHALPDPRLRRRRGARRLGASDARRARRRPPPACGHARGGGAPGALAVGARAAA